jgi:hypothetical protein
LILPSLAAQVSRISESVARVAFAGQITNRSLAISSTNGCVNHLTRQ